MKNLNSIIIIPARKGSKGLPNKNIKKLNGKPLVSYSIEYAQKIKKSSDIICVSSDDERVEKIVKKYPMVEFLIRPKTLAKDNTSMESVIKHLIDQYEKKNLFFDSIVLLQPTSPIRKIKDFKLISKKFNNKVDMVVSVKKANENPYYSLFEENKDGYLVKSKSSKITRRQDAPDVYCLNGSFFMININSLKKESIFNFSKILKVEMPIERSIDIDTKYDLDYLNFLIDNKKILLK